VVPSDDASLSLAATAIEISNYHARATDRFLELVAAPRVNVDANQRNALERARKRLSGGNPQD
jgi:hypothetical protein